MMSSQPPEIQSIHKAVAGIILAAGGSTRMGQPKLLLPWRGEPIIRHVTHAALAAGLSPVLVVTGAYGDEIKAALSDLQVQIIPNPGWEAGQSTSVRAGIQALPAETGAVIFMLADQPQIPPELVQALVKEYIQTQAPVIAPLIAGRRGNPALFDRAIFQDLLELRGDAGARQILGRHPPHFIPWDDERLLLDVDTPEDYQKLILDS